MKWSWKIGRAMGIDLRIHATFLLLLVFVGVSYWTEAGGARAALGAVGFLMALFVCVVLHELGHAFEARRFGIKAKDIVLLPFGGVARLERIPEEPAQELRIALAGPVVSIAIAVGLFGLVTLLHEWQPVAALGVATGPFLERLMVANVWLVLFNLIPAFPMDGGRVLRAVLASRMTYFQATQTAAAVGRWIGFGFGLVGLFTNPMLLVIGVFVWIGATQEAGVAQMRSALSATPTRLAMLTDFETLGLDDTLADAARVSVRAPHRDVPVIDDGRLAGMLTESDMLAALAEFGDERPVKLVMRREFPNAEPTEMLETVFQRMIDGGCETITVMRNERLIGLVTMDALRELMAIDATVQKRRARLGLRNVAEKV